MSKQPSNNTKRNLLRRGLAGILSLALLLGLLPAAVAPAQAHWADSYVNTLVDWGVMRGDINGNMAPERSITRAEFVTMMNRAYGYTNMAGHPFTDVNPRSWYNDDIDIAYNVGYFKGTSPTTASPNSSLTREQAAVLLARNMMMQPTVGETLGFSDSRTLSDWSRGLVGAAAENGVLSGYSDGSFKPQASITRGEVAAMLVRAIGTPISTEGDHKLGNVYGNVTVNTSGVQLRDGVITGNLYLTGGIDLGSVLMENITVLGEIVVSGAGESDSSKSSIVLRNVTANAMTVDSIGDQFVTIRAEGNTDINTTTVRTNAYVDDSALTGYGLWKIIQDGGSLLQLAGNPKEVINQTPNSELQVVQGSADKVTIDEKATNSSVLVDGDARVDELDLDVATKVTGEGDIKNLNVGAAGTTVEQLPDSVTIRPGITTDINGSTMNSSQAAAASAEPRLLAGYPKAKNVAPTSATLVFSVNKPGTIYWAVSAVSDGSVSEEDLIENPSYGGKIIKAGSIKATEADTEYTANVSGLTQDGSYYISAILVDNRGVRSPVKVAAFSTPDGTVPAFVNTPTATLRTVADAQVTGTPNKSCLLYWALLPEGATAPTAAEFKANAVSGNLGYGSMDVTKNVSQSVKVNRGSLKEKTNYVAYLWLTDHDGAKSSQVYRVPIYIPDQTPPEVHDVRQTNSDATSVEVSFAMNETGKLHWAIVTDEMHEKKTFINYDGFEGATDDNPIPDLSRGVNLVINDEDYELSSKIKVMAGSGQGAIVSGSTNVNAANTVTQILMSAARGLDPKVYNTSTFYVYYVGEDSEDPSNLSERIGVLEVNVKDTDPPLFVEQRFDRYNENDKVHPLADTGIKLVFSEPIQHGTNTNNRSMRFLNLYKTVEELAASGVASDELTNARETLAKELHESIKLYDGTGAEVASDQNPQSSSDGKPVPNVLDYRYAVVTRDNGEFVIEFPHNTGYKDSNGDDIYGANLKSGGTYHFEFTNVYDCASTPNRLQPNQSNGAYRAEDFRIAYARVDLEVVAKLPAFMRSATKDDAPYFTAADETTPPAGGPAEWDTNPPQRIDRLFTVDPLFDPKDYESDPEMRYDILIWSDADLELSLYSRPKDSADDVPWELQGTVEYYGTANETAANGGNGFLYRSLTRDFQKKNSYDSLSTLAEREYVVHVDRLTYRGGYDAKYDSWNETVNLQVMVVAGSTMGLAQLKEGFQNLAAFNKAIARDDLDSIGTPDPLATDIVFTDRAAPKITDVHIADPSDTRPKITVTLDHPGQVNYLIIPLTSLMYTPAGATEAVRIPSTVTITEPMIQGTTADYAITGYSTETTVRINETDTTAPEIKAIERIDYPSASHMGAGNLGTVVASPSWNAVVGSSFPAAIYQGRTSFVSADVAAEITLPSSGLTPNTIYYLCLVPQGSTPESVSKETRCFRFTTDAAKVPILSLAEAGSINVNATVDCTAQVQARLLRQRNLTGTIFSETMGKAGNMVSPAPAGSNNYTNYTVLQALEEDYPGSGGRSVFDMLASDALKQSVSQIVERGASTGLPANTIYDNWGPRQVPQNPTNNNGGTTKTDFNESQADENDFYVCIGVAYVSGDGPRAFRALPGLQLVNDQPPRITSISNALYYDETKNTTTGSVTITFDKDLYLVGPDNSLYPMAQSSSSSPLVTGLAYEGTKNQYRPLQASMTLPSTSGITITEAGPGNYLPTPSIILEVNKAGSASVSVTLPVLYSKWNNSQQAINVTISYRNEEWVVTSATPLTALAPGYRP